MLNICFLSLLNHYIFYPFAEHIIANPLTTISYIKQQEETKQTEIPLELNYYKSMIVGTWRGFQETEDISLYYGYQFRANGSYLARYRAYQGEETIFDQFFQGEWDFDGRLLSLNGTSTPEDVNDKTKTVNYKFRWQEDNFFYYQEGNLVEPFIPKRIGKLK